MAQNYSANAVETSITSGIDNDDTAFTVADAAGWPTANFVVTFERDTVREEQAYVTSRSGTSCTGVTRGFGSTTGVAHGSGAEVHHTADALSMQRWEDHLTDTTAHAASAIVNTPAGGIAATTVQAALNELDADKATATGLSDHLVDTSAAHAASAVSFSPTGTIAGTDAQTAIAEVATDAATALTTHEADTTSVHGIANTANVVLNTRQVISGNGLTGGGALSGDLTLAVGAGTGISVAADAVAVDSTLVTLGAWSAWTPTLRQGASDLSITVNMGSYARFGRLIVAQAAITINALGTAFNVLKVSWPVAPKTVGSTSPAFGSAYFHHHSFQKHSLAVIWESATYMAFIGGGTNTEPSTPFLGSFGVDYVQVSSGDIIGIQLCYEAAS